MKKDQLKRLLIETAIFMALFFWLPFLYQMALTVILSLASEYFYTYLARRRLLKGIDDNVVRKIQENLAKEK
jgi:hypothetical protein